jgi:anti-sigma-K factor RskA
MLFARNGGGLGGRGKNNVRDNFQLAPAYREDDHEPYWFDVRHWRKRNIAISVIVLVAIIVIVIAVTVVEVRANAYPNYSQLTYTLTDTC